MAPVTRLERDAPPLRTATVDRLERLAGTLARRGMEVSLVAPPARVPRLQIGHPAADGVAVGRADRRGVRPGCRCGRHRAGTHAARLTCPQPPAGPVGGGEGDAWPGP